MKRSDVLREQLRAAARSFVRAERASTAYGEIPNYDAPPAGTTFPADEVLQESALAFALACAEEKKAPPSSAEPANAEAPKKKRGRKPRQQTLSDVAPRPEDETANGAASYEAGT